jgi:hypothetical protein
MSAIFLAQDAVKVAPLPMPVKRRLLRSLGDWRLPNTGNFGTVSPRIEAGSHLFSHR